jgi:RecG-like helicase
MKLPLLVRAIVCISLGTIIGAGARAEEKPATTASPTQPAALPAPAEGKVFSPTELEALKVAKGQKIVLQGKVSATGENRSGSIRYLNFTQNFRESVSLVFFAKDGGGTFTKEKLAAFVGKTVRVNGTLTEYNGSLQIRMESLDQIKVVEEPAPAATPAVPATPAK